MLILLAKIPNWHCFIGWFVLDAASLRFTEPNIFAEILFSEFVFSKANLLAETALSLVWLFPSGFS